MKKINRRRFTRLALGGIVLSAIGGCASRETPDSTASVTGTDSSGANTTPTPNSTQPILQNENRPGFYISYYKPFRAVDPTRWSLSVEGLVKKPQKLTQRDIQSLPLATQVSRMKCVECWSATAKWEGFRIQSLMKLVEPLPEAKWVHFYCADDYYESLPLEEVMKERVLFAYRMNDRLLPDEYGAPLRLIVPFKYGYKGPKAIIRLVFAEKELKGYWSTVGPYSTKGDIEPGLDHPLDLGKTRHIDGGEIKYPEGIESKSK